MQERSQAVDSINKTIAELGTIFTQLANMVHEQGQLAQRYVCALWAIIASLG